ncbi:MAG TPA: FtsX-like permease family protein [Candidatus Bathyarchaeia archaeon]|nr:FtsX-like permease family protein [Candidatus Bathyarchaeia archaeon]
MSLSWFILRNAFRNKRRTLLTVLSIGFSLFLLITLFTFLGILLNPVPNDETALRLIVRGSSSLIQMMPISYLDKIKGVPNVEFVAPLQWANGIYKEPKNFFANFATDPDTIWDIYTEQKVTPETRAAFIGERTGAVVGEDLIRRFGWEVGDTVTLLGTIFPVDLEFKIVGVYTATSGQSIFYFRYDYLNEAMGNMNLVGAFTIKATSPDTVPGVIDAIDTMFRNSPSETKTETEKAFVLGFVSMLGNVQLIIGSISLVVLFTMLLVAVSTMAMTVRERLREVAILKTIGFPRRMVLWLIIGEAVFISCLGFCFALVLTLALTRVDIFTLTQGFVEKFSPGLQMYAMMLSVGIAIGLVSGFFPAMQAANMSIIDGMRKLE